MDGKPVRWRSLSVRRKIHPLNPHPKNPILNSQFSIHLTTFDRLTDSERFDLASEILKRTAYLDFPPLSDEDLVLNAEEIFPQLD
jgi:hypothetical protein